MLDEGDGGLQFYPPNEMQEVRRENGRVTGNKTFDYYIIPDEPGTYDLKDYLSWIYFNVKKDKYDTLSINSLFKVTGESKKNTTIRSSDLGTFYNRIPFEDTSLRNVDEENHLYLWLQGLLVIVTLFLLYILIKK